MSAARKLRSAPRCRVCRAEIDPPERVAAKLKEALLTPIEVDADDNPYAHRCGSLDAAIAFAVNQLNGLCYHGHRPPYGARKHSDAVDADDAPTPVRRPR